MIRTMYNTIRTHSQLTDYWTVLTRRGLLRYDSNTQTFKTTRKGRRSFNTHNQAYAK
jgi:predicted transcriptional regulator